MVQWNVPGTIYTAGAVLFTVSIIYSDRYLTSNSVGRLLVKKFIANSSSEQVSFKTAEIQDIVDKDMMTCDKNYTSI